jgi:phosphoribosyl 1,2-cyclic phosphodiesterase
VDEASGDSIRFLGTAGARFVMITQARSSAGALYEMDGFRMLVDPGPGCLVRCLAAEPKVEPATLDAILLTHAHLDHAGDANVMIEAMTQGGHERQGTLYAPREALDGDPIVMRYVRRYLGDLQVIEAGRRWDLTERLTLTTPLRHVHGTETYGFRLETPALRVSHVSDTFYFEALAEHYGPCDVLVLHVVLHEISAARKQRIQHLDVADATRLVGEVEPQVAVITHFGMNMLRAGPERVAAQMSDETGVQVIAARDGLCFPLGAYARPQVETGETRE